MERDAKGRFVKKGDTTTQAKAKTKVKATKKAATKKVYRVNFDSLPEELKTLITDMEAHGLTCVGADVIELCAEKDKKGEIAAEFDEIFRSMDIRTGAEVPDNLLYGLGVGAKPIKGKKKEDVFNSKIFESLNRAKEKLKTKDTSATKLEDTTKDTPMRWELAEPLWVKDLHEIYEEGSIPQTEEDMRQEIIDILGDTAKVILGFMCYLEAKEAVKSKHTCKCNGKCKGRK